MFGATEGHDREVLGAWFPLHDGENTGIRDINN